MLKTDQAHILVVDDDDRIRELLQRYLSAQGYLVSVAPDAAQARKILRVAEYDLCVLDVMMPGETGLELCAFIRASMMLPVILLTAKGEVEDRIEGLESGADDYLPKPFEPKELVLRIESILRRVALTANKNHDDVHHFGPWCYDARNNSLTHQIRGDVRITEGEAVLLSALLKKVNMPITRDVLAQAVGLEGNDRAIDVQITRLRRKIEDTPKTPQWIQTLRGQGYVLRRDVAPGQEGGRP